MGFSLKVGNTLVRASGFLRNTIATVTNIATYPSNDSRNDEVSNAMITENYFNQTSINKLIKDVSKMTENHKVKSIHASTKQTQINWYNLDKRDSYLPETLK